MFYERGELRKSLENNADLHFNAEANTKSFIGDLITVMVIILTS